MIRRLRLSPVFRRFHDSPPERGEEGWAGVASSFDVSREQTGDVAGAALHGHPDVSPCKSED